MNEVKKASRTLVGTVVSTKMQKTIAVRHERKVLHPLYKKYVKRFTTLLAHDPENHCQEGDVVLIEECRPLSRKKSWNLQKVIDRFVSEA
jgi:small subunit ribosomal protein S17